MKKTVQSSLVKTDGMIYNYYKIDWMSILTSAGLYYVEIMGSAGKKVALYQAGWLPKNGETRYKPNIPILCLPLKVDEIPNMTIIEIVQPCSIMVPISIEHLFG